ncbi:hypothetical protein FOCC_FOCC001924 [Frankliniella occidentalis]|nr:hypothetical protein FOCC_FOCC001924 [Frankliniella occidentalis]
MNTCFYRPVKMKRKYSTFKIFDSSVSPIDWSRCVVCQTDRPEELTTPSRNRRAIKSNGISTISRNLKKFQALGKVPRNANVDALDAGRGIEANLLENDAKWHKSCYLQCGDSKVAKVEKKLASENIPPRTPLSTLTRQGPGINNTPVAQARSCFVCSKPATRKYPLNRIAEEGRLLDIARKCGDDRVLVILQGWQTSAGVWYHNTCRSTYIRENGQPLTAPTPHRDFYAEALFTVIAHINAAKQSSEDYPVFVMTDLAHIYTEKLKQSGIEIGTHTSRLREELLKECPYLEASVKRGQKCLVSFKKDINTTLRREVSGVGGEVEELERAADLLRRHIFSHSAGSWAAMSTECVSTSTPPVLQHFVKRLIDGPNASQNEDNAGSTISQLIFFNARKRHNGKFRRQCADRETPAPVYVAMKLFGATRSKDLVNRMCKLGLCISYSRLKLILTERANKACTRYLQDRVVCPLSLETDAFTTVAVDNLDHNTTSMTAKGAFHGTVISVTQHGPPGGLRQTEASSDVSSRKVLGLPSEYTSVPLTFLDCGQSRCPVSSESLPQRLFADPAKEENDWLDACGQKETINTWSGFHSRRSDEVRHESRFAVLPPFHVLAHTVDMMSHSMTIAQTTTKILNPAQQVSVLTGDLPLFSLCKQIQWLRPGEMGEEKMFIMMGGMHIEKAAYTVLGDLLEGSGWSAALVQAKITTKGRADSMISASHITRTRYAHQVTAAVFHSLKKKAYEDYAGDEPLSFQDWCSSKENIPQFKYCDTVLKLILAILQFVRATRTANIVLYIEALCRIVPYFFAMDHTHYARWLPIHIRDLVNLPKSHPQLWEEFKAEIADIVAKFEEGAFSSDPDSDLHHLDTESARETFSSDISALEEYFIETSGNPFAAEGSDLYNFDTRRCASKEVSNTFLNLEALGNEQYQKYTEERLVAGTVSIHAPIKHNKLPTFSKNNRSAGKKQQNEQIKALKEESNLFGRMFVAISNSRPSNLNLFFSHESHEFPPSLFYSDGKMRFPEKCDLLNDCLFPLQSSQLDNCPNVTAKIVDGGYIARLLTPGISVTFLEFRNRVFIPYLLQESSTVSRMDIVWDRYIVDSLKSMTRENRGEGCRTLVTSGTKIPKNWQDFLRNSENKTEFFALMAEGIPLCKVACHLYSTFGEAVLTNSERLDVSFISPCNHEEADTRVFLHVADAVRLGHSKILIRSSDTDIVVLAVTCLEMLPCLKELWIHTGTGKRRRYIATHEIANSLKLKLGCDTVEGFHKIGKKSAWKALILRPETVEALLNLAVGNIAEAQNDLFHFIMAMYSARQFASLTECRRSLFGGSCSRSMKTIPPTEDASVLHFLRASHQAQVWSQLTVKQQALPSPSDWGFLRGEDGWKPVYRTKPTAEVACKDIVVKCHCKVVCVGNCSCFKVNQKCTDLCICPCKVNEHVAVE